MPRIIPLARLSRLAALTLGVLTLGGLSGSAALAQDVAAADTAVTAIALPPALERVLRDYEAAWQARDPDGLAALFTVDGFVLRSGHPPVRGRDGIREAYANSGGLLHLTAYAYAVEGDVGWIVGGYGPRPDFPPGGKYVLALRQGADGRWLIAADMDNSNR